MRGERASAQSPIAPQSRPGLADCPQQPQPEGVQRRQPLMPPKRAGCRLTVTPRQVQADAVAVGSSPFAVSERRSCQGWLVVAPEYGHFEYQVWKIVVCGRVEPVAELVNLLTVDIR